MICMDCIEVQISFLSETDMWSQSLASVCFLSLFVCVCMCVCVPFLTLRHTQIHFKLRISSKSNLKNQ